MMRERNCMRVEKPSPSLYWITHSHSAEDVQSFCSASPIVRRIHSYSALEDVT